jgi:hypothetical protein
MLSKKEDYKITSIGEIMGRISKEEKEKIKHFLKKNADSNPLVSRVYSKDE